MAYFFMIKEEKVDNKFIAQDGKKMIQQFKSSNKLDFFVWVRHEKSISQKSTSENIDFDKSRLSVRMGCALENQVFYL